MSVVLQQDSSSELRLAPVTGPERKTFGLGDQVRVAIGRARESQICLNDASVSRTHAALERRDGRWFITDLHSRHGTFVNGSRLEPSKPTPIQPGDLVRLGSCAFRLEDPTTASRTFPTTDDSTRGQTVRRIPEGRGDAAAQQRLDLLMEGALAVQQAADEAALAQEVAKLVRRGTGFRRAAVLRHTGSIDAVELIAFDGPASESAAGFDFSRSLLREAATGHMATLSQQPTYVTGQSIDRLGIQSALCAPIQLDAAVSHFVYLDAREDEGAAYRDAASFCQAVARVASLALSKIKDAELRERAGRIESEMQLARGAQQFLSPRTGGVIGPLNYVFETHPGRFVAGDLFDIFELGPSRVAICFGDVSGQGIGAGLVMAAVLAHLRATFNDGGDPAASAQQINTYLAQRAADGTQSGAVRPFVSLFLGVYDGRERVLRFVDAGHGYWAIRRAGGALEPAWSPRCMVIGADSQAQFACDCVELSQGDRLVLYSDGIVEHRGEDPDDRFGRDRLHAALNGARTPAEDIAIAMKALREFTRRPALDDDTTLASIEVRADGGV